MLQRLFIENVALIERLEIEFHAGFNVLTGETGAGKSIIIDAVNFVLGERANRELIGTVRKRQRWKPFLILRIAAGQRPY